jgi:hypothetical protein
MAGTGLGAVAAAAGAAAQIAINETLFVAAQDSLKASYTAFEPEPGDAHESTSDAITLTLYRAQFNELASVMDLYHQLVQRDIDIIQKAHDNITETDTALSAGAGR